MKSTDTTFTNTEFCGTVTMEQTNQVYDTPLHEIQAGYASAEALNYVRASLVELQKEIKQLRQWLAGGVDSNGRPIPGVLQTIDQIRSARKWILGLLGAIAVSSMTNAAMNLVHQIKLP